MSPIYNPRVTALIRSLPTDTSLCGLQLFRTASTCTTYPAPLGRCCFRLKAPRIPPAEPLHRWPQRRPPCTYTADSAPRVSRERKNELQHDVSSTSHCTSLKLVSPSVIVCLCAGILSDLYSYEPSRRRWTRLSAGGGPAATFFPSFVAAPSAGLLFTFGGDSDPRSLQAGAISISPAQPQNFLYTVPRPPVIVWPFLIPNLEHALMSMASCITVQWKMPRWIQEDSKIH
jgi:hypothetical protein